MRKNIYITLLGMASNIIKKQRKTTKYIKSVMQDNMIIEIQGHQKLNRLVLKENCLCDIQDANSVMDVGDQNSLNLGQNKMGLSEAASRASNPQPVATCWTTEETECLFDLFQKLGSKWTKISQMMPGKTQNCIKNRFYGSLRKVLRRMNKAAKKLVKKFKKELKFESITRIIDASQGLFRLKSPLKEESGYLSKKIISLAKLEEHEMEPQDAQQLIKEINKFNMLTRSYKSQKKISHGKNSKLEDSIEQNLTKSLDLQGIKKRRAGRPKLEQMLSLQNEINGSSTHQQHFLSYSQNFNIIKQEAKQQLVVIKHFEEDPKIVKKSKSLSEFILQELQMEVLSPLECEAWL